MHVMECGDGKGGCLVCGHARCACPWRVKDFVRKAYDNAPKLKDGLYDDELTGQKLPWYRAVLREEKGNERLWTLQCWLCKTFMAEKELKGPAKLGKTGLPVGSMQVGQIADHVKKGQEGGHGVAL